MKQATGFYVSRIDPLCEAVLQVLLPKKVSLTGEVLTRTVPRWQLWWPLRCLAEHGPVPTNYVNSQFAAGKQRHSASLAGTISFSSSRPPRK